MLGPVPCGACGKFVSYCRCCLVIGIEQGLREAPQKPGKLCVCVSPAPAVPP